MKIDDFITKITEQYVGIVSNLSLPPLKDMDAQNKMFPGPFSKNVWLPLIQGQLKPSLFGLNWDLLTEETKNFVLDIQNTSRIDILAQVPGEGKTCRLLALAHKMFVILITCTDSVAGSKSTIFADDSFVNLKDNLDTKFTEFNAIRDVKKEVDIYYCARLFHLYLCLETRKGLNAIEYILLQINGNSKYITKLYTLVRYELLGYNLTEVDFLLKHLVDRVSKMAGRKIAFCIDDLNVAASEQKR